MTDAVFTDEDLTSGAAHPTLGPAYFASRRVAERFMAAFEAEHFKPLIEKFNKEFTDDLWRSLESHLMNDTESNLQGDMWRMVDRCVEAILSGEKWVIDKYALGEKYNCEKVRAAVAAHIPVELQEKLVLDLQDQVKLLKDRLRFYQDR